MPEQVALQRTQGGEHLLAIPGRVEVIAQRLQLQVQLLPAAAVLPGLQQLRRLSGAGIPMVLVMKMRRFITITHDSITGNCKRLTEIF